MVWFQRIFTEALDIIYNDDVERAIYVEPPDRNVETDEGGRYWFHEFWFVRFYRLVDNLTTCQLLAKAEIRLTNNRLGTDYYKNDSANINLDLELISMLSKKSTGMDSWRSSKW